MIFLPHFFIVLAAHLSGELQKKSQVIPRPFIPMNQND